MLQRKSKGKLENILRQIRIETQDAKIHQQYELYAYASKYAAKAVLREVYSVNFNIKKYEIDQ